MARRPPELTIEDCEKARDSLIKLAEQFREIPPDERQAILSPKRNQQLFGALVTVIEALQDGGTGEEKYDKPVEVIVQKWIAVMSRGMAELVKALEATWEEFAGIPSAPEFALEPSELDKMSVFLQKYINRKKQLLKG